MGEQFIPWLILFCLFCTSSTYPGIQDVAPSVFHMFAECSQMFTGGKPPEALLSPASIHIVTHESQLPSEFLYPSPEKQFIIGFDCEGVDLCRYGTLCIMQMLYT